jgi:cysteine synthase
MDWQRKEGSTPMIHNNILQTISNTPLIRINRINPNPKVEIYAKIEGMNPGGSIKDRIALKMIEQAEAEGVLTRDKTIIEATSGNTGIALAIVPDIYNEAELDEIIMINTESAFEMARKIIREEAIFVGMSSGASMVAMQMTESWKDSRKPMKAFSAI